MIFATELPKRGPLRAAIDAAFLADEAACVEALLPQAAVAADADGRIADRARQLVLVVRERRKAHGEIGRAHV